MAEKPIHMADKVAPCGDVSAKCYKRPRAIDLRKASWALEWKRVTCPKCLKLRPDDAKTVRDDWSPPLPAACKECGEALYLSAYRDLDEWSLTHTCEDGCDPDDVPWPFVKDKANKADLEACGFKVE